MVSKLNEIDYTINVHFLMLINWNILNYWKNTLNCLIHALTLSDF